MAEGGFYGSQSQATLLCRLFHVIAAARAVASPKQPSRETLTTEETGYPSVAPH